MKTLKNNYLGFRNFCHIRCDGIYNPGIPEENQSDAYHKLKHMLINNIRPATMVEIKRWENDPTEQEMTTTPNIKYLRFIHPNLRPFISDNWDYIRKLK